MTDSEIEHYIDNRGHYLTQDEIHHILDVERNPQIDHYELLGGTYKAWTNSGGYFKFFKRQSRNYEF